MRKFLLLSMVMAFLWGSLSLRADVKSPYTVDFNETIDTNDHAFQVASNWQHIVDKVTYTGTWSGSTDYYVSYTYYDNYYGVDGSGSLFIGNPFIGDPNDYYGDSGTELYDILVTPLVTGDVKLMVYPTNAESYVEVYAVNSDGSKGDILKKLTFDEAQVWHETSLTTASENKGEYNRYGIRGKYVYIDNFEATSADIVKEPKLTISTYTPGQDSSSIYFDQQANGKVFVKFMVTVTNSGEVDLKKGEENFSITVFDGANNKDLFTVAVPQDLAVGQTSAEFEVSGEVETTDLWESSWSTAQINLRENITGKSVSAGTSRYNAYESKFVLRPAGSNDTWSLSSAINYGLITEPKTTELEIYNDGAAPLTIVSMSLTAPFTGLPAQSSNFVIGPHGSVPFSVTLTTEENGSHSGNLTIVYLKNDGSQDTHTIQVSGNVVDPNAWICDFGTDTGEYPAGSVVGSGISLGFSYDDYGNYLKATNSNSDFILPKFDIKAGDKLSFETARDYYYSYYGETYGLSVYVSTDRYNWGEPIKTFTDSQILSTDFQPVEVELNVEGEYYVKLTMQSARVDNICAPRRIVEPYDIYLNSVAAPEEEQGGKEISFTIQAIAVADMSADDYKVEYRTDDEVLCSVTTRTLKANPAETVNFDVKFTPEVAKTTVYDAYVQVTFADGSVVKTPAKQLTIVCQPEFVFFDKGTQVGDWGKPSNRTEAISFGTTNTIGAVQEFEIYNWGAAPLKVNSIEVPAGFGVNPASATIAAKERQTIAITMTATEPGSYSGNLVIRYEGIDGAEIFELPISGVMLDSNKWYAEIVADDSGYDAVWPAGTIHGANITATSPSYSDTTMGVTSNYSTDNMFVSPKLHAEQGEILEINARDNNSYYTGGTIKIYVADSREGLENADSRTEVAVLSASADNKDMSLGSSWAVSQIAMPAGDYYVGFEITDNAYINYFYGLKKVDVAHDLKIVGVDVPATVMHNNPADFALKLHNYNSVVEKAGSYKVTAFVDGVNSLEVDGVELPCNTSYADDAAKVSVPLGFPEVGTFKVCFELNADGYTLKTEELDVAVVPEVLSSDKQIGEFSSNSDSTPLNFYNYNSESVMLYTASDLGLTDGESITSLTFKGYVLQNHITDMKVAYKWVDGSALSEPESGLYDLSDMTVLADKVDYNWPVEGGTYQPADILNLTLDAPLKYESGKSLMLYVSSTTRNSKYLGQSSYGWQISSNSGQCYSRGDDYSLESANWSAKNLPVLYLKLAVRTATVSGTVYDGESTVEGAVVKLVSNDGDNVQYRATTGADGKYSVNVVQNSRSYDITATADGKEDILFDRTFKDNEENLDFSLMTVVEIDNVSGDMHQTCQGALVKMNMQLEEGLNAIVLPFDLDSGEIAQLFGSDAEVAHFSHAYFEPESGEMLIVFHEACKVEAGKPFLVKISSQPASVAYRGKDVTDQLNHSLDVYKNANFCGTYVPRQLESDEMLLDNDVYVDTRPKARDIAGAAPYSAYIKLTNPDIKKVSFTINNDLTVGVDEIPADGLGKDDLIFTLQGVKVSNPDRGIYIVNGKRVLVK